MKKLQASEITEPGPYWVYTHGSVSDHPDYLDAPPDDFYDAERFRFIKAEPPKVCRWEYLGFGVHQTGCDDVYNSDSPESRMNFTYCPFCGGHIEVKEKS